MNDLVPFAAPLLIMAILFVISLIVKEHRKR